MSDSFVTVMLTFLAVLTGMDKDSETTMMMIIMKLK